MLPRTLVTVLSPPAYYPPLDVDKRPKIGLAVESMKRHMTDEGWQIFDALQTAGGYKLYGHLLGDNLTDVTQILKCNPSTLLLQDKREWDTRITDFREKRARFKNVTDLFKRHDIFKLTILKDAQQKPLYHQESASEIGCHAWIVYYHPIMVKRVATYVRNHHLIRTYHTVNSDIIPPYSPNREMDCLLSGAISDAYPLRKRLYLNSKSLPYTTVLEHPGYHMYGCQTPKFINFLSSFKVAICTASRYGYALRKIMEATAAGCKVITDLPPIDKLPHIDGNLIRVPPSISIPNMAQIIKECVLNYNSEQQKYYSDCAKQFYDYRVEGLRLANEIEKMRLSYSFK